MEILVPQLIARRRLKRTPGCDMESVSFLRMAHTALIRGLINT